MNTVRKWGLKFDGTGNPLEFIERLTELAKCYDIPQNDIIRTLPEIFRGTTLEWLRIKSGSFTTWEDFHQAFIQNFLPPRYLHKLEDEIFRRRQGPREKAKEYIWSYRYLIHQHPRITITSNIDRIFDGLRPEYRLYIKRTDFKTIDELIDLTEEFESIRNEERNVRLAPTTTRPPVPITHRVSAVTAPYDRQTHCWNCKQRGHRKENCRRSFRLFCSFCGEDGILSKDCSCRRDNLAVMRSALAHDPRYFVPFKVGDQVYQALLDTGSTKTYVGKGLRDKFREWGQPMYEHCRQAHMANGTAVTTTENYKLEFALNGVVLLAEAAYLPSLDTDAILGMDLLSQAGLQVFLGGEVLTCKKPDSADVIDDSVPVCFAASHLPDTDQHKPDEFMTTELPKFDELKGIANVPPHRTATAVVESQPENRTNTSRPVSNSNSDSDSIIRGVVTTNKFKNQLVVDEERRLNYSPVQEENSITMESTVRRSPRHHDSRVPSPRHHRLSAPHRQIPIAYSGEFKSKMSCRGVHQPLPSELDPSIRKQTAPDKVAAPSRAEEPLFLEPLPKHQRRSRMVHDLEAARPIPARDPPERALEKAKAQRKAAEERWFQLNPPLKSKLPRMKGLQPPLRRKAAAGIKPSSQPDDSKGSQPLPEAKSKMLSANPDVASSSQHRSYRTDRPSTRSAIPASIPNTDPPVQATAIREGEAPQSIPRDPFAGIEFRGRRHHRTFSIHRPWGHISVRMNRKGDQASLRYKGLTKTIDVKP